MTNNQPIGFSQRIQLEWLEYTANLVLAGNRREAVVVALSERLRDKLSVGNEPERGNRDKAITILAKVWVTVPGELRTLRDEGLDILRRSDASDRMLVHWCMCMAVYPFFGAVADATGRLLRLQGTAAATQVQRRLREQLGERETVVRAARRILRTFIDWGVLRETGEKGLYRDSAKRAVNDWSLVVWTIKAVLFAKGRRPLSVPALLGGPHLFPFDIPLPATRVLEACEAFEVVPHGLAHDVLISLPRQDKVRD